MCLKVRCFLKIGKIWRICYCRYAILIRGIRRDPYKLVKISPVPLPNLVLLFDQPMLTIINTNKSDPDGIYMSSFADHLQDLAAQYYIQGGQAERKLIALDRRLVVMD